MKIYIVTVEDSEYSGFINERVYSSESLAEDELPVDK